MGREYDNHMKITFDSISENEKFARIVVAAFIARLNPTMEEMSDIKTAVSEAVTNCIIHGYENEVKQIEMEGKITGKTLFLRITDFGKGIPDVEEAMQPMFTTGLKEERSGMGFSFMEAFMDRLNVVSEVGKGTVVEMEKEIGKEKEF
ncbi:MAG: anti-sigma F factor [Lachnospiraceae bacterium]|nr:anti-sigma F factor [Lachnospiraceae bacterium]